MRTSEAATERRKVRGLVFALLIAAAVAPAVGNAQSVTTYYGAPYFHHGYANNGPHSTVSIALQAWWADWNRVWPGYGFCGYQLSYRDPAQFSGQVAQMLLNSPCSGGNGIFATAYTFDPEKGLGPEKCHAPQTHCGNPINVATGNKYQREVDFEPGAEGLDLVRHYNSHPAARPSGFGARWTHSYDRRLEFVGTPTADGALLHAYRGDGSMLRFKRVGGVWVGDLDGAASVQETALGWQFVETDPRVIERYDPQGRLAEIISQDGNSLQLTYNNGVVEGNANDLRLTQVVTTRGRRLTLEYVADRISRAILPDGNVVEYVYDTEGRLARAVYSGSSQRIYHYNEPAHTNGANLKHALTGITDEAGQRFATFTYIGDGRAASTEHAGGATKFSVSYLQDGGVTVGTPLGSSRPYAFSTSIGVKRPAIVPEICEGCEPRLTAYTYDQNGRLDEHTDPDGAVTDYDYDSRGRLVQKVEAKNDTTGAKRTVQTDWHASFAVPLERRTYDAAGTLKAKSTWTYNGRGQMVTSTEFHPVTNQARTTATTYCEPTDVTAGVCPIAGLVLSVDGPRTDISNVTTYQYYAADHPDCVTSPTTCAWRKGDLWKVTNAAGQVTETLRYDGAGRALSSKDANGVITDFDYHARGWLTARKIRGSN